MAPILNCWRLFDFLFGATSKLLASFRLLIWRHLATSNLLASFSPFVGVFRSQLAPFLRACWRHLSLKELVGAILSCWRLLVLLLASFRPLQEPVGAILTCWRLLVLLLAHFSPFLLAHFSLLAPFGVCWRQMASVGVFWSHPFYKHCLSISREKENRCQNCFFKSSAFIQRKNSVKLKSFRWNISFSRKNV